MMGQEIECMIACQAALRRVQASCVEALVNAEAAPAIFTAQFISGLLLLVQNAAALRAQVTEGQAFVRGSEGWEFPLAQ